MMRPLRSATLLAAAALLVGTAGGSVAVESVDIGATAPSPDGITTCGPLTTYIQDLTAVPPSYTTTAGVVTSWSSMATAVSPGIVTLKIAREGPADTYTITGSAEPGQLVANRLNSFRTRIPVQAGDVLALYLPQQPAIPGCLHQTGNPGDVVRWAVGNYPDPVVGTIIAAGSGGGSAHLNVSARIEPDVDGDGYGDLTQDACPLVPTSHIDCTAPDTSAVAPKSVKTSKKKAKVTLVFASEPGATFTCALDGGKAKPCASPFTVRLKVGKHHVGVTATDAAGNADSTPATATVKVKKKA